MLIWFCLFIPLITAGFLYWLFRHKLVWWELLIPLAISFLLIVIFKYSSEAYLVSDTEWWTSYVKQAREHEKWTEEWDEWVSETTDDKGNTITPGHYEHHIQHHPPYWEAEDHCGLVFSISQQWYHSLARRWGNNTEKDLRHSNQTSHGDGDLWYTNYTGARELMEVCTSKHRYENRVQASRSIFNYPEIIDPSYLIEYPETESVFNVPCILGPPVPGKVEADKELCKLNAELGKNKQIRMWILVYENKPIDIAMDQEAYWKGGNKNELVLCLGMKDGKVGWSYVFSWTEQELLKVHVRQHALHQDSFDLMGIVKFMGTESSKNWVRKEFADFSYLTVDTPSWAIWTTFVLTILANAGASWFAIANPFTAADPTGSGRTGRYRYG